MFTSVKVEHLCSVTLTPVGDCSRLFKRGTGLLYCFVVITLLIGGCAYKTKIHIMKLVCEQVHSQYGHLRQYGAQE